MQHLRHMLAAIQNAAGVDHKVGSQAGAADVKHSIRITFSERTHVTMAVHAA